MKSTLAISLLFMSFNCFGSIFNCPSEDTRVSLARLPALAHFCNKADAAGKPDVKEYITIVLFGEKNEQRLMVAKEMAAANNYQFSELDLQIVEARVYKKAQQDDRKDVCDFMNANRILESHKQIFKFLK